MSRPAPVDAPRVSAAVARHLGIDVATVEGLRRLSGGASRETWSFDVLEPAGARHALVLRRDPSTVQLGSDRSAEYHLLEAVRAAGAPVPGVRFLLDPDDDLGAGFVMDRIDGETIPRRILRDDAFAGARPRLVGQIARIAAQIHATPVASLPRLPAPSAHDQIAQYRAVLDGFGEPHPALELGLRWLDQEMPAAVRAADASPRLVHGDLRNGNFIVGPEGIRAVLDWELSHLGDPVEDLGWLCVRAWRFGNDAAVAGGFGSADDLRRAYEAAGGGCVEAEHLRYWQAFGTLKWGVICEVQCFTHLEGNVRSVELAALGRRIAENEWDLLELIG